MERIWRKSPQKQLPGALAELVLQEGLFLLSGLGSHGFQTAFLAADILTSLCAGSALPIEREGVVCTASGTFSHEGGAPLWTQSISETRRRFYNYSSVDMWYLCVKDASV